MQLPEFQLERYFARYEFHVRYLLCASDCEAWTVQAILDLEPGAAERFQQHWLGYTESQGSPSLREAICALYTTIAPAQVLVHSGAEEAIYLFMHALLQPGDHLIVHSPCYQSLTDVARSLGCPVTPWQARPDNRWRLDLDELHTLLRPETRAIVLNTPHNPTGYLISKHELQTLYQMVENHGCLLFSDEVYRESEYAAGDRLPAACDLGEHAVSLGVMSKSYGLAGLRIGWIATHNHALLDRMAMLKDYTTICSSAPSEFLAEIALRHRQFLLQRNVDIIRHNLDVLDAFFARHAERFAWQRPNAGPIAFPRPRQGDINAFCQTLVQDAGVLLLPGTVYGDTEHHFRIGFGRKDLPEALAQFEAYLNR